MLIPRGTCIEKPWETVHALPYLSQVHWENRVSIQRRTRTLWSTFNIKPNDTVCCLMTWNRTSTRGSCISVCCKRSKFSMSFRTLNIGSLVRTGCTLITTETFLDVVWCRWSRQYMTIRRGLGRVSGMVAFYTRNWTGWCKVVAYYQPSRDMFGELNDLIYVSILSVVWTSTIFKF